MCSKAHAALAVKYGATDLEGGIRAAPRFHRRRPACRYRICGSAGPGTHQCAQGPRGPRRQVRRECRARRRRDHRRHGFGRGSHSWRTRRCGYHGNVPSEPARRGENGLRGGRVLPRYRGHQRHGGRGQRHRLPRHRLGRDLQGVHRARRRSPSRRSESPRVRLGGRLQGGSGERRGYRERELRFSRHDRRRLYGGGTAYRFQIRPSPAGRGTEGREEPDDLRLARGQQPRR